MGSLGRSEAVGQAVAAPSDGSVDRVSRRAPEPLATTADGLTRPGGDAAPGRIAPRWWALVLVAVNVPIVVATVRALARGWQPLGDNGILLVRARDVGTAHNPSLGSWTSASLVFDQHMNNPGALYFDVVALPVKLLGPWVGLAIGVMLVNMAASTLAVVVARRISGIDSLVAVAVVVVGLQWAMGSELLFDVWQPNALVLPMFAFLVVATVLATGDLAMAPWFAGLASLLVQTHMSHAPLVAALTVAAVVLAGSALRRRDGAVAWRRPLGWALAVTAVVWALPLVEQVSGPGPGNLSRIGAAMLGDRPQSTVGLSRAVRIVAEVTVVGPWFTRSSYESAVPLSPGEGSILGLVPLAPGVAALAAVVAGLVAVVVAGRRRADRRLATMGVVSIVALVAAPLALAASPVNVIGIAVHQMRWVWPIAAMATATLVTALLVARRAHPVGHRRALATLVALALVAAVANLPTHHERSTGPVSVAGDLRQAQELVAGLEALEGRGTVLFDGNGLRYGEPYTGLVFAELQDHGIPFVFDDEGFIRQFGEGRRNRGEAVLRLWQVEGDTALTVPAGAERVGFADGSVMPVALLVEPIA